MNRSSLTFGIALVAVGTLLLLDELGTLEALPLIAEWWPLVVILAGVSQVVTRPPNPVGGVTVAIVGIVLLAWTTGSIDGLALLWPTLLIALGVWLLVGRSDRSEREGETIEVLALVDDRHRVVTSPSFRGGEIVTLFGDADLDLRHAAIGDGATLQVTTIFGDAEVTIPESWRIDVSGPEIFGEVDLRGGATEIAGEGPVLRLRVVAIFGDLRVIRVPAVVPAI